jgi:signal transduction histidine kinase
MMRPAPEATPFFLSPPTIRYLLLATLAAGNALALSFYPAIAASVEPGTYFRETYFGSIGASILLSAILIAVKPGIPQYILLALRAYVLLILGYSIGGFLSVKLVLATVLMIETACLLSWPASGIASGALAALLAAAQAWPRFFGPSGLAENVPRAAPEETAASVFAMALAAATAILARRMCDGAARLKSGLRLQEANLESLAELNLSLQGYARTVDEESSERERARISREIHDISGYIFTNLIALMDAAGSMRRGNDAELPELLATARSQAQEGLRETRMALRKLRAEGPRRTDSPGAIHKIVSIFRQVAGVRVELSLGNLPRFLSRDLNLALYRTVQEALTNAIRHGKASAVRVGFWVERGEVLLNITDNGVGADVIVKGIGLSGMEERLGALGGSVRTGRSPEGGFSLWVRVPLTEDEAPDAANPTPDAANPTPNTANPTPNTANPTPNTANPTPPH